MYLAPAGAVRTEYQPMTRVVCTYVTSTNIRTCSSLRFQSVRDGVHARLTVADTT